MPQVIRIHDQHDLRKMTDYPHAYWPYESFNPVQSRLLDVYSNDANVAVSASTSAGKTICAEIFMANAVRTGKGKAIYIGPMRALAVEKKKDWTKPTHHFADLNTSICTGDYRMTQARVKELDDANLIVMTPEMLASRARNSKSEKSRFLHDVGVVAFDESHLLTVPDRGDHIEIALMKLTEINPQVKIVLLSATMPNTDEICGWISDLTGRDTYFLESKYRPVPLGVHHEVYYDGDRGYRDREEQKIKTAAGIINYYSDDKILCFAHTIDAGQSLVKLLARYGVKADFHYSKVSAEKREAMEEKFKSDPDCKVLVATSTLAWGINCPARRVIIMGVDMGMQQVPNYQIRQMSGRSGRLGFDPRGDVYILVPESRKDEVVARLKIDEPIRSQLLEDVGGHYKTLAFHVVSEIHYGQVKTKEGFHQWFQRSLARWQNQEFDDEVIDKVIGLLLKTKCITVEDGEYKTTGVGAVASLFYFSPFDAADLKQNFKSIFELHREDNDIALAVALGNLDSHRFGICNKNEQAEISPFAAVVEEKLGGQIGMTAGSMKAAAAYWNLLNGQYSEVLGSLQMALKADFDRTAEVLNALDSLSAKWGKGDFFKTLKLRVGYGVAPHLVGLCQIPNIGAVRSEKLYKASIRSLDDFINADVAKLAKITGMGAAKVQEAVDSANAAKLKESL
jgi:helicase